MSFFKLYRNELSKWPVANMQHINVVQVKYLCPVIKMLKCFGLMQPNLMSIAKVMH